MKKPKLDNINELKNTIRELVNRIEELDEKLTVLENTKVLKLSKGVNRMMKIKDAHENK